MISKKYNMNKVNENSVLKWLMFETKVKRLTNLFNSLIFILVFGALPTTASAVLIDPSIVISGSAEISLANSAPPANATQSGFVSAIVGGVTTMTTLSAASITGTNPLANTLTNIGDGFGIGFNANGTGADSQIGNLFGDYSFSINNTSLIDTFTVNLKLDFTESVNATGTDVFAQSQIRLADSLNTTEFLFLSLISDTSNGNQKFVYQNPLNQVAGFGGALSNSGSIILSFILAPGATVNLGDTSFEVNLFGGAFNQGDSFSTSVSSLYTVDSVVRLQNNNVPEPQLMLLTIIGLVLLGLVRWPLMFQSIIFFQR